MAWTREDMAQRAAKELRDGFYVNLGIGIPTLVANYIPDGMDVTLQSENGMLGMGPFPTENEVDADLINAGKQTVTALPKTSYFSSADSFGDDSRWSYRSVDPGRDGSVRKRRSRQLDGAGQACERHGRRDGSRGRCQTLHRSHGSHRQGRTTKLLKSCTLPLTGVACIDRVITNLGMFDVTKDGLKLVELASGVTGDEVAAKTEAKLVM